MQLLNTYVSAMTHVLAWNGLLLLTIICKAHVAVYLPYRLCGALLVPPRLHQLAKFKLHALLPYLRYDMW